MSFWDNVKKFTQPYSEDEYDDYDELEDMEEDLAADRHDGSIKASALGVRVAQKRRGCLAALFEVTQQLQVCPVLWRHPVTGNVQKLDDKYLPCRHGLKVDPVLELIRRSLSRRISSDEAFHESTIKEIAGHQQSDGNQKCNHELFRLLELASPKVEKI